MLDPHMADWTEDDIAALKAAIKKGAVVKSITFGDQTLTFRSLDEMKDALAMMRADVNVSKPESRRRFAAYDKGC